MNDPKENIMTGLRISLAKPWFDNDEARVAFEVVNSRWLIFGKNVEEFENEFSKAVGVKYAVAVNSGSSALLVALASLGVKGGDEVMVPDMTFISTATAAMFLGAVPKFVDIELKTYCMDHNSIEKNISNKTKVIIPVHYAGQSAEMEPIVYLAKKYKIAILEDAAEAHLSEYKGKKCGTLGEIGIFSFTPSKPMTTGEGGMVVTNNEDLAKKARLIRNFGDTDKFKWEMIGFNFRMPEVMGAIGRVQLRKLEEAVAIRRRIAFRYQEGLKDEDSIILPYIRDIKSHNFQLYTIRLNLEDLTITRDEFINKLSEKGISSRLYYPALHNQGVFKDLIKEVNKNAADFINTIQFAKTALSLPIYPDLQDGEIDYVIASLKDIAKENHR